MHRFFLPPEHIHSDIVVFPPELSRQLSAVLHVRPGKRVIVLDDAGGEYQVELTTVERNRALGQVVDRRPAPGEPRAHLTLYLALSQREKFEWMLQKCTEIGAAAFAPIVTCRSLVQDERDTARKLERWQRILREAAEQSQRGRVPTLRPPLRFEAALETASGADLKLVAWEREAAITLRQALKSLQPATRPAVAVFIGPEGGFSEAEIAAARRAGFQPITLGERILRMETAAMVTAALLLHEIG